MLRRFSAQPSEDAESMTRIALVCAGTFSVGALMWGASRMLYYPVKYPGGNWSAQSTVGATDVWLQSRDGTKLHAWWIPATAPSPTSHPLATLHLHGNGGNITDRVLSARHINAAGSPVLLLDYRGYGRSSGRSSETGLYQDAEAAYDWIISNGYSPEQIVIHGESLGTAVAVHLATERPSAGLVLEAPFTSARAVAGRVLPIMGPLLIWGYNSMGLIRRVRVPLLIIHGDRDEVIAFEFGQELFKAANNPKWFWTIHGATHNNLHIVGSAEFPARLAEFYRTIAQP
jgi:fermentation-respiration switch protein FrsA (DUF1100 family)